jgi:hypothetical protein
MLPNDSQYYTPTPRTLQTSKFGPYARLSVPPPRRRFAAVFWMLFYGVAIGGFLYLLVAIRVGA